MKAYTIFAGVNGLCNIVQIYDNSGCNTFDIFNPLLVAKNGELVLWNERCPQYLKESLNEYVYKLSAAK